MFTCQKLIIFSFNTMFFCKYTEIRNHRYNPILDYLHYPKKGLLTWLQLIPLPSSIHRQPLIYILSLLFCLFQTFHVNKVICSHLYLLLSLGIMIWKFIHFISSISCLLKLNDEWYSILHWSTILCLFIYQLMGTWIVSIFAYYE